MERAACVECSSRKRRVKLLRCLHTLCVACVEAHLTSAGEVACPKCSSTTVASISKSQARSLPDAPPVRGSDAAAAAADGAAASSSKETIVYCDECIEDSVAVSVCHQCKSHLCKEHASVHRISRSTHKHQLEDLPEAGEGADFEAGNEEAGCAEVRAPNAQVCCSIHPSCLLHGYCSICKELVCAKCQSTGHDGHSLLSIGEAAGNARRELESKLSRSGNESSQDDESESAGDDGDADSIRRSVEDVDAAIKQLYQRTEELSEKVMDSFDSLMDDLLARRNTLLKDLDRLRNAKLVPLEEQKARLLASLEQQKYIHSLLSNCESDVDLLRMMSWLEEANDGVIQRAVPDQKPCVESNLALAMDGCCIWPEHAHGRRLRLEQDKNLTVAEVIESTGTVMELCDPDWDLSQGPDIVAAGRDFKVFIPGQNALGEPISRQFLKQMVLAISDPDGDRPFQVLMTTLTDKGAKASYCPPTPGRIKLHVSMNSQQNFPEPESPDQRSSPDLQPYVIEVLPQTKALYSLWPDDELQLSNDDCTATCTGDTCRLSSAMLFTEGRSTIRLKLERLPNERSAVAFGVMNTNYGLCFIWCSNVPGSTLARTYPKFIFKKPFLQGDIVSIQLDFARRTLVANHERTKTSVTERLDSPEVLIFSHLEGSGTAITLLP